MNNATKNLLTFGATILVIGLPAYAYLQQSGFSDDAFKLSLRVSARIAILIYLTIFVARPLRQLVVSPFSKALLANRRYFGIAFAAVMTAHLVFLIALNGVQPVIPGIIAYLFIYAMLVTSFDKPTATLGPRRWRILHKTGLYLIGGVFSLTIVTSVIESPGDPVYLGLATLMLIALSIRITAWLKRRP